MIKCNINSKSNECEIELGGTFVEIMANYAILTHGLIQSIVKNGGSKERAVALIKIAQDAAINGYNTLGDMPTVDK